MGALWSLTRRKDGGIRNRPPSALAAVLSGPWDLGAGGKEGERKCILMGSDKEDELPLTSFFPTDRPSGEEVSFAMYQPGALGTLSQMILQHLLGAIPLYRVEIENQRGQIACLGPHH